MSREAPLPVPKCRVFECRQEGLVEGDELGVGVLVRIATEEDGKPRPPPFDLAVVHQPGARLGERGDGHGHLSSAIEL